MHQLDVYNQHVHELINKSFKYVMKPMKPHVNINKVAAANQEDSCKAGHQGVCFDFLR